jgi:uncharacterized DUF497 family protein
MQLVEDPDTAYWLDGLEGEAQNFEWDAGNRTKLQKHGVKQEDVESMFQSPIVFAGRVVEPAHDEPRWLVLGRNVRSRKLALLFTRRGERVRPISCRAMRRNEREVYEEAIREEGQGGNA